MTELRSPAAPVDSSSGPAAPAVPAQPSDTSAAVPTSVARGGRYGWIDALRGIAAVFVVFRHVGQYLFIGPASHAVRGFDPGLYGVMVFFLVSGYIVPASLERRGSIRRFWISRLFRIYPMAAVAVLAAVLLVTTGIIPADPLLVKTEATMHPLVTTIGNLTMLQDLLGVTNTISVMWTLSYEMAFYLLLTALFVFNVHRHSAALASGLALVALVAGGAIPVMALSHNQWSTDRVAAAALAVMVLGLALVVSRRRTFTVTGALVLAGMVLILLTTNGRTTGWQTMVILATMFCGTAIYRADEGQLSWRITALACGLVLACSVLVAPLYHHNSAIATLQTWTTPMSWTTAVIGAWLTFAAFRALRRRRMPRVLTWLGSISYSVYLVHTGVLAVMLWLLTGLTPTQIVERRYDPGTGTELLWTVAYFAVVFAVSYLTYRLVELPGQALGRRLIDALTRRRRSATPGEQLKPTVPAQR
jgi:peptidoglycan/LPS O-acetylase OafA/YrhL